MYATKGSEYGKYDRKSTGECCDQSGKRVGNFYTKRSGKAIRYQSDIVWTADKTDDRKWRDRSGGKGKKYTLSACTAE